MNGYYGYIRVSTTKQGEQGVSLQEQREAIKRYASQQQLTISDWFEERETAAKRGRPVFGQMLKLLRRGKAAGVIIHKIDRSARNLKDWADLGDLIDAGVQVHFANETLDLHSRGGRLSADIQAVVAADYIRNLREEIRKGFYGRLNQGLYPLPAPFGYKDQGKGKSKIPDPVRAPLVRLAFQLYGSGQYTLDELTEEMYRRNLRSPHNGKFSRTALWKVLKNPFYMGLIRIGRTGQTFPGKHEPIVTASLFTRVQEIMAGKTTVSVKNHDFTLRRLLVCRHCGRMLTGEVQKNHVYYRCHTRNCPTMCIREEAVEVAVWERFSTLGLTDQEKAYVDGRLAGWTVEAADEEAKQIRALSLRSDELKARRERFLEAYVDRLIDRQTFEDRNARLLLDQKQIEESMEQLEGRSGKTSLRLRKIFELAERAWLSYEMGTPEQKRRLLQITTSNRLVSGKNVEVTLSKAFALIADRRKSDDGAPSRNSFRTLDRLLHNLMEYAITEQQTDESAEQLFRSLRDQSISSGESEEEEVLAG